MKKKLITCMTVSFICLCSFITVHAEEPKISNVNTTEERGNEAEIEPEEAENENPEIENLENGNLREPDKTDTQIEARPAEQQEDIVDKPQEPASQIISRPMNTVQAIPRSKKLKVLMVGNSLTYNSRNRTISDLKNLARKAGRKIEIKRLTYNNEKMKNWANPRNKNGKRLYAEIRKGCWDYIILQEQTDAAVTSSFLKASKKIADYIRKYSPKSKILYNCTWAYKKGKKVAGKRYSFSSMQKKMNQNYQTAANQSGGRVCWSGNAFLKYRKSTGTKKNLYLKDNNHASRYGWYLNACCLYNSIFGKSAAESKYYAGFGKNLAKRLQQIAAI